MPMVDGKKYPYTEKGSSSEQLKQSLQDAVNGATRLAQTPAKRSEGESA
jgi:hypothetical protein